jgi:hypothetical protein
VDAVVCADFVGPAVRSPTAGVFCIGTLALTRVAAQNGNAGASSTFARSSLTRRLSGRRRRKLALEVDGPECTVTSLRLAQQQG